MDNPVHKHLHGWIPAKTDTRNGELLFQWRYMGYLSYNTPFFDEALAMSSRYAQNAGRHKSSSTPAALTEWGASIDSIEPTAFIFHVSRCGSTLVSQALGMKAGHISVAEVPLFDALLRLGYKLPQYDEDASGELLKVAIQFYGAKRTGDEQKLFIKTDCWHLLFHSRLRRLYPHTPFIIIYRNPEPVLHSNQVKKGVQGVYGLVEPQLLGLENITSNQYHPDVYMTLVLEKFYQTITHICQADNNTLLLNYNQGLPAMMQAIAGFTGIDADDEYRAAIDERSRYHAKHPGEKFTERDCNLQADEQVLQKLNVLYEKIEQLRKEKTIPA